MKLVKTPWEAAMENPFGYCDSAFARINPDQLADTVMRRADYKRAESLSRESSRMEGCLSPVIPPLTPAGATYDIYHAKPPKGWLGNPGTSTDYTFYFHTLTFLVSLLCFTTTQFESYVHLGRTS